MHKIQNGLSHETWGPGSLLLEDQLALRVYGYFQAFFYSLTYLSWEMNLNSRKKLP